MIRIIDLDHLGKFLTADNAVVFTVNVGGEKLGLTAGEVAELVRAKLAAGTSPTAAAPAKSAGRKGAKAQSSNRTTPTEEASLEADSGDSADSSDAQDSGEEPAAADQNTPAETDNPAENSTF